MKIALLVLAVLLVATACRAADPAPPDTSFLKQFAETRRFQLGRPQNPKVSPDGKTVLFLRAEPGKPALKLFEFDVATAKTRELLSPQALLKGGEENLTPEEKARRERMRLSAGGIADFHFDPTGTRLLLPLSGKLFVFDRGTEKATELKTGEGGSILDPKWSPDGKKVSYVRGYDVYTIDVATNTESAVTKGGTALKPHGIAEFVAQEEMARFTGYWWSPDSKFIAYQETDHTGVETWFVADPFKPDQKPLEQFYPRPGKKNAAVRLGVVPVEGGDTVWAKWDAKEYEYLAAAKWDKRGGLTVQLQDRKQQRLSLRRVDPATGKTDPLLEESDAAWLNLSQDVPKWYDKHRFLWLTERDGDACAVLVDTRETGAARTKVVTPTGLQVSGVVELVRVKPDAEPKLFVIARSDSTTTHVWSVLAERRSAFQLDRPRGPGQHALITSSDLGTSVSTFTSLTTMPQTWVEFLAPGKELLRAELPSVAVEPNFKPNVSVEKVGDFYTAIVRPKNFDAKKKYPVILDVYGGPKHLHVIQAMRNWLVPQWLADQGFVVVAVDNRGTPGRGREWERAVYQKFGTVPLEDQVKGLHLLCDKFPELDRDRVGIVGWSFGGYMAANGVLRKPDVFKAAVAGAPVTDWEDYDTHYAERYMGVLPEARKAYDDASLLPLAKDLKRPLLLVHGTADDNVYYRHSLKLADALFRAGRDFESLPLPGVTHMYTSDPVVVERLWARTATFFRKHLGEPK